MKRLKLLRMYISICSRPVISPDFVERLPILLLQIKDIANKNDRSFQRSIISRFILRKLSVSGSKPMGQDSVRILEFKMCVEKGHLFNECTKDAPWDRG